MKTLKVIGLAAGIVFLVSAGLLWLHARSIQRSHLALNAVCASYQPGAAFLEPEEKAKIEQRGLSYNKLPDQPSATEFRVNILSSGMEPSLCEVKVKGGKVLSAK